MQTAMKFAPQPARNWTLKFEDRYYERDDEQSSMMIFTPAKCDAERFTLAEAEHFVTVAKTQSYPEFSIVSAGGESWS